jgi:hypothetical protein
MPPKSEQKSSFSYAIGIADKNGVFKPTNMVKEPTNSESTLDNAKTSSVRYFTNDTWTQLDENGGTIAFQTDVSRLTDNTKRVLEKMQITSPHGTNYYASIYNDGGIALDGSTSSGTTATYYWLGGSDPNERNVIIEFKKSPSGQKIRTGKYEDNDTNMASGDDDNSSHDSDSDSDSEAHDDDKKKNNSSFGMSMGLLRKIFD